MDLFAAGFEYNEIAEIGVEESRKALLRYESSMGSLHPVQERTIDGPRRDDGRSMKTAGGIHAVIEDDSARLFVLGSTPRGIPYRQWEIPLPVTGPKQCDFCPRADVIVVVESQHVTYVRL